MYPDGSYYEGEMEDNLQHGLGKMAFADYSFYEGGWKCGRFHGKGGFFDMEGNKYIGEWVNGRREGIGHSTEITKAGEYVIYEGRFLNDHKITETANKILQIGFMNFRALESALSTKSS